MSRNKKVALWITVVLISLVTGCSNENTISNTEMGSSVEGGSPVESEVDTSPTRDDDKIITQGGVYEVNGTYEDYSIVVEADEKDFVEIVLNDAQITNASKPAIYVKSADTVTITIKGSTNYLATLDDFATDEENNIDAVIFSKSDLVFDGLGTLEIKSNSGHGVVSKDNLTVEGGRFVIEAASDGFQSNETLVINDGNIDIKTCKEGLESTQVYLNGGTINIYATDDGINASQKTDSEMLIEVNGGNINVQMATGDTDAFDSNGTLTINGGTITVSAMSAFDSDGLASLNGGDVTVNGEKITQITQMQMGKQPGNQRPGSFIKKP